MPRISEPGNDDETELKRILGFSSRAMDMIPLGSIKRKALNISTRDQMSCDELVMAG
jgi:hypothetical protein